MRAVLITGSKGPVENLYIGEVQTPKPEPGEVLVKIKAFGLNRMDIHQREGEYPVPKGASPILGVEFSGIVVELGTNVKQWKEGDEVFGLASGGAYAEYIVIQEPLLLPKPSYLSWVEAASLPEVFLTAFQALVLIGEVKKDDNVLVHTGASGVGLAAIQLARQYGAHTVITTTSTQEKIDWILSLPNGPSHAANYKTQDFAQVVNEATQGQGANVVIDFVGKTHFQKNLDCMAVDGRMTILAMLSGSSVDSVNLIPILLKRLHIVGSTLRSRSVEYQAELISRFQKEVLSKITGESGHGPVKTYIYRVYPWTHIQDAHREMENNKNSGKIIAEVV